MLEADVVHFQLGDKVPAKLQLFFGKVYPHTTAVRQVEGHGNKIAPTGATQFKYAGLSEVGATPKRRARVNKFSGWVFWKGWLV